MIKSRDPFVDREAEKYAEPIASREWILQVLTTAGESKTFSELYDVLRLKSDFQALALKRRLKAMVRDGQLLLLQHQYYWPATGVQTLTGEFNRKRDPKGSGWLDGVDLKTGPQGDPEWVVLRNMGDPMLFAGSRVTVQIPTDTRMDYREARLVTVNRYTERFVLGRFQCESGVGYLISYDKAIPREILISNSKRYQAHHDKIVKIRLTHYLNRTEQYVGEIIEVLGSDSQPGIEIKTIAEQHQLPHEFSESILNRVSQIPSAIPKNQLRHRQDLRHLPFITIDGEDARDFDDAVYCEPKPRGGFRLWVAIADVSYYVKINSELDREARTRGTSVYFPGSVIPMLPERLSNDLCSLVPHQDRLVFVCQADLSKSGQIMDYTFFKAMICSQARLTYSEVQKIVTPEASDLGELNTTLSAEIYTLIQNLSQLYIILFEQRNIRGALDFRTVETKMIFNAAGKIQSIVPAPRLLSHRIIEECMLVANVCAAKCLKKHNMPGFFRNHAPPTGDKLAKLKAFLQGLGLSLPYQDAKKNQSHHLSVKQYQALLAQIEVRPDRALIEMIILRSMQQAEYACENHSHFGLGYLAYTHFTSPIRRYPDLWVHRFLDQIISDQIRPVDESEQNNYARIAQQASLAERRADEASRDVSRWLKCQWMQQHVGARFSAMITHVANFGFFAELNNLYVDGLVPMRALSGDYFQFDPVRQCLIGDKTGKIYRLGQTVSVEVTSVDVDARRIDLKIVQDGAAQPPSDFKKKIKIKI